MNALVRASFCSTSALILSMAVACQSDPPTQPSLSPSITLSLSPGSVSVVPGDSVRVTVTITRGGGFDGAVSLTVTGAPSGVTVPAVTIDAGATVGTIVIAAAGTAEPETSILTVDASGTGVTAEPQSFSVVVLLAIGALNFISIEADGYLVMTDFVLKAVVRVHPITGDRTIVSDSATGSGPAFSGPQGIAVEADGNLVVADQFLDAVVRVDWITGDRTIVSNADVGMGPGLFGVSPDIAVEADGNLLVTNESSVQRIHPVTGDRTILSGPGPGSGLALVSPAGIAVERDGNLVVTDEALNAVFRIDPITGDRTIFSDVNMGTGPALDSPFSIAVEADGNVVVADTGALVRVDPVTGDRSILGPN